MTSSLIRELRSYVSKSSFKWRYVNNLGPLLAYRLNQAPKLAPETARVLSTLNRDGISVTSVADLLGEDSVYDELQATIDGLEVVRADEIAAARALAGDPTVEKSFNFSHVIGRHKLCANDVFMRFAMQKPILQIANAYFGMFTTLRYCNVWHTFATDNTDAHDSQLWHHDRDDRYILKVFVYLSDVDEGAGPFTYAPGTHPKGKIRCQPRFKIERPGGPKRTEDEDMAQVVSPDHWVKGIGPKSTIVFADTRGYHFGGRARSHDRLMYILMFASSATARPDHNIIQMNGSRISLDRAQSFALSS